ncbi:MAG: leucine-rich repeat domain-containing protein, partial [Oscillospiraceae bacterium]|nr:leucine-rich repeat domain-containing protein [Oscillospiraceae bacterium]
AGIGGGFKGNGSNIEISGGSVKAVAGEGFEDEDTTYFPAAIGQGVQYDGNTGVYSNGAEVTPTYGADNVYLIDNVYLLELDVDGTSAVTINGKAYPTKHIDENKLYVYLPAGNYTVANGNSQKLYTIADDGTVSEVNAEDTCICTEYCTSQAKNQDCPVCKDTDGYYGNYINCALKPTSGNCGAVGNEGNVIWNFDTATGTLTISGTGAMADYDIFYGYPVWSQFYRESIKKIVIGYGVTRIGTDAFYDCLNAEEVVFERNENGESSVTSIGNYAFWTIDELNNIVVPASVETIGDNVFRSCNSLTSIVFEEGSSLGTIGNDSFNNLKNSEECIIPSKVTSIGDRAFRDNDDLKHFYYPADVIFGTNVFYYDSLLEYFGEYTVNENDKTCSISYIGVGQNEYDYYPDENAEITASEIVIPEKIDGYKVTSVEIGETAVNIPPESFEVPHTTTKLSDITALEGWEYEAETDEIPAGSSVEITASYNLSETQKLTKKITVSRAVCVDEEKNHSCDLCGAVISGCEEYMSDWSSDETEHQRTCTYCGKIESAAHISSGPATSTTPEKCTVCGYIISPATGSNNNSSSGDGSSSSSKESPNIEGKNGKKGWSAILDVIEDTKEGEKVVIDMNDATELPKNIFKEIKGKDITIVLNMDNGFIWTINGKDVENPKTIDMGVKKGTRIPVKVINEVTGESKYIEITLSHNGDFGFKAVLTVDMGKNNKGNFANLYYYN